MKLFLKHAVAGLVASLLAWPTFGQKISADPTAATLSGGEFLAGVQTGANVKVLPSQILAYTLANIHSVNGQTGTSYTYLSSDRGKLVTHSNASTISAGLSQAIGSFGSGWFMLVQNRGAGTLTITPTTSTIDGAATLVLTTGQGAFVISDGTNWYTLKSSGGASVAGSNTQVQYNNSGAFGAEAAFTYDAASDLLSVANVTTTGLVSTAASATGGAGFRMPHGTAPTSPTNGDVWTTTAGLYARINGATVGPFGTAAGSNTQVQYNSSGALGAEAAFAYDASTNTLTVDNATTSGLLLTAASATGGSGFRLPHGAAPTSPTNGDMWTTSAGGLYVRINGSTVGPLGTGGGGSLTHFTESVDTAAPNATVPVVQLLATNAATNVDFALAPKGTGALSAHSATSSSAGGNKRGVNSVDWQTKRTTAAQAATGAYSVIGGGENNTSSGADTTVAGGIGNTASTTGAAVGGGNANTASGANSIVAGGSTNTASGNSATVGGGTSNSASGGNYPTVAGGASNTASGTHSSIGGGGTNTASGSYSTIPGGLEGTTRGLYGAYAQAAGGLFGTVGANQFGRYLYKVRTTDNTVTTLALDGGSPASTTVIVLPNESVYSFRALASATQQSNTVGAGWTVVGTIRRDASAGTTTLVGTPTVTSTGADAGASTWAIAAVANTTRGSLEFTVTGENSKTIRWTIVVETAETTE